MPREVTTKLLEMVDEGTLDARKVLASALGYMSEADVKDMAECEGFVGDEDEPDDEDEETEEEDDEDA